MLIIREENEREICIKASHNVPEVKQVHDFLAPEEPNVYSRELFYRIFLAPEERNVYSTELFTQSSPLRSDIFHTAFSSSLSSSRSGMCESSGQIPSHRSTSKPFSQ